MVLSWIDYWGSENVTSYQSPDLSSGVILIKVTLTRLDATGAFAGATYEN
jgi:hypothetical protein